MPFTKCSSGCTCSCHCSVVMATCKTRQVSLFNINAVNCTHRNFYMFRCEREGDRWKSFVIQRKKREMEWTIARDDTIELRKFHYATDERHGKFFCQRRFVTPLLIATASFPAAALFNQLNNGLWKKRIEYSFRIFTHWKTSGNKVER